MAVWASGVLLFVSVTVVADSCPDGTYGYNCGYKCNCDQNKCDPTSGCSPPVCSPGWSGPTCQKHNVARGKTTSSRGDFFPSSRATDGNTAAYGYPFCIETDASNPNWWRVDLNDTVLIRDVTIYFRTDYKVRRNGIQIYIADTAASPTEGVNCYNVTGNRNGTDIPDVLKITCSGEGRYLVLYTTTVNNEMNNVNVPIMDFCEVEVDVCSNGTFGGDCDNYCHCDGEECDYVSGICPSGVCLPGWTTASCDTVCQFGHYGPNCNNGCLNRNCKGDNSSCDYVTGQCVGGCMAGWNGTDCTQECLHSYGDGCSKYCSDRKCDESSSDSCDHVTGRCDSDCRSGWKGTDCTEACLVDVEYGAYCSGNCSARMCEGGTGTCPQDTGRCESGCQPGWKGEDCTQVCSFGSFGANCTGVCGQCVDNSACHHVNGSCLSGCSDGWTDHTCTRMCSFGSFGANCTGVCGQCVDISACHHVNGSCLSGCSDGWTDHTCTQTVTGSFDHEDRSISHLSAGLLGALAMLVSMAAVMGGVCLWRRKTKNGENHDKSRSSGNPTMSSPSPTTTASDYDVIYGSQYATLDGRSPDVYESLNDSGVYSNSQVHI